MVNQTTSPSNHEDKISDVPSPSSGGVKKIRKARIQSGRKTEQNLQREENGGEYNIWYHKYIGQQHQKKEIEPAETRCNIKTDAGWTVGCTLKDSIFCLFFAHGRCAEGPECKYLHRIPTTVDGGRIPITKDCFGRPKHATDRDDMSGVGSFNRDCRTLYVSGFKYVSGVDYEEVLLRHFKEWGEVEYIRAFPEKCYAFVKYKNRLCAEFAKEAMLGQSLDNDDVIHIRWSADDPNPLATKRHEQEMKNKIKESLEGKDISTTSLPFHYPEGYKPENPIIPEHLEKQINSQQQTNGGTSNTNRGTKSVEQQYYQHYLPQQAGEKKSEQAYRDNLRKQGALANDDRKKVDYFNYIKGSNEKSNVHQQVSSSLGSKVAASYPNTDSQVSQLSKEQQEQYQKFFQQFSKQLGQKK